MARRLTKTRRRPAPRATANLVPYREIHEQFFRLRNADWTPPSHVRVTHSELRIRMVADFATPEGNVARLATCLRRSAVARDWSYAEESMAIRFTLKAKRSAAK